MTEGKKGTFLLRLLGIAILAFIINKIDIRETIKLLQSVKPIPFIIVVMTSWLMIFLRTIRWQILLRFKNVHIKLPILLRIYAASYFIGSITPARLGELSKAYYIKQFGFSSLWEALPSVIFDRGLDIIFVFITGLCGLLFWHFLNFEVATGIMIGFFCLTSAILFNRKFARWTITTIFKIPINKLFKKYFSEEGLFIETIIDLTGKKLLLPATITFIIYSIYFMQGYILARAVNMDVSYFNIAFALSCAMILSMLPITIAGIGTREAGLIFFLAKLKVSAELAFSFSLGIFFIFGILLSIAGAVCYFSLTKKAKLQDP